MDLPEIESVQPLTSLVLKDDVPSSPLIDQLFTQTVCDEIQKIQMNVMNKTYKLGLIQCVQKDLLYNCLMCLYPTFQKSQSMLERKRILDQLNVSTIEDLSNLFQVNIVLVSIQGKKIYLKQDTKKLFKKMIVLCIDIINNVTLYSGVGMYDKDVLQTIFEYKNINNNIELLDQMSK
jgi:hypothetical protein